MPLEGNMAKHKQSDENLAEKRRKQRHKEARKLRLLGCPYDKIARLVGYDDEDQAREELSKSYAARKAEAAEAESNLWHDRLEDAFAALAPAIYEPEKCSVVGPKPVESDYPIADKYLAAITKWEAKRLEAIGLIIKLAERFAKMKGLDAPKRVETTGNLTVSDGKTVLEVAADILANTRETFGEAPVDGGQ